MLAQAVSWSSSVSRGHLGGLIVCHYSLSLSRGPGTMRGDPTGGANHFLNGL